VGWSEPAIFGKFGCHIYGAIRVEASVIVQRHEALYQLSNDPNMLDLA